jgi:peptide/nickel transport system ATP-binding protein
MTDILLRIDDLHLEIHNRGRTTPILRGVDLTVERDEIRGLVGESGGGKTMVGKAIMGVLPESAHISAGRISFEGRDLLALSARARRSVLGRSISMVLQQPMTALNPVLRIETQMTDVLRHHMGLRPRAARAAAMELLDQVRIAHPDRVLRQYPHELSGGMCQRVAIAIAFACRPSLIIADEPTTALDVTVQFQILKLLKELQRETGAGVIFVTHDLGVVAKVCDKVSVMHGGRILEDTTAARMFAAPSHPYTAALIEATPRYDRPEKGLHPISKELSDRLWEEAWAYDRERAHA